MPSESEKGGLIIPHDRLSRDALRGLIEEFITREGTDSGYTKGSLEESVGMVMRQLIRGEAFVLFDQESETANIVSKKHLKNMAIEK